MKIAIAQLNFRIADFEGNLNLMRDAIKKAEKEAVDLIVFSELSICGYPPLDLLEQRDFIDRCGESIRLLTDCTSKVAVIVGSPAINPNEKGKKLYNAAYLLANKEILAVRHKTLLPTYDIFDEYRYFEPNSEFNIVEFKGLRIALTICEDIWDDQPVENAFSRSRLYTVSPMDFITRHQPGIMINISASPFAANRINAREEVLRQNVSKYGIPLFYCNQVGANTELIFDGSSMVLNRHGMIVDRFTPFAEEVRSYVVENLTNPHDTRAAAPEINLSEEYRLEMMHKALVFGIKDYFSKMGFKRAVLGLSGGMDSALTLVLAVEALGAENVLPVLMPSRFSSDHSITDSIHLANNLGVKWSRIPVDPMMESFLEQLKPEFLNLPEDVTEENLQARIRGVILMALANKQNMILLNTSNKSEAAVGYATLYGDMNGGLSVLGDVYKTDVYAIARYVNRYRVIIPPNIFIKAPSAELRPGQKDSDSLPEYNVLDLILYRYIEMKEPVATIISNGFQREVVEKVISLVNRSEYKRFQSPPILRVSSKAFGMGRRMPIVAKY
ncbi:MAG: NAD+ synthase [Porphyromonadaceae bacterium]|nr:MAG: NAD+ synthase [Porphyromonadaceae bacterium]